MTCLNEVNGTGCGLNAICFREECVCSLGFFRPRDFGGEKLQADCLGSILGYKVLYSLFFIALSISAFVYLRRMERFSQIKRLMPYFISLTASLLIPVLKFTDYERAFTVDPALTTLHAFSIPFAYFSNYISQRKYLKAQHKLVPIMHKTYEKQLRRRERFLLVGSCISVFGALLYLSTIFLTDSDLLEAKIVVIRVAFAVLGGCVFSFIYALLVIGNGFERDLRITPSLDITIKDVITRASEVKAIGVTAFFIMGIIYFSCVFSEYALFVGTYTVPIQIMTLYIAPIFVLRANVRKIDGRPNPRYNKSKSSSSPAAVYKGKKPSSDKDDLSKKPCSKDYSVGQML